MLATLHEQRKASTPCFSQGAGREKDRAVAWSASMSGCSTACF
jgi:hypothetical protein